MKKWEHYGFTDTSYFELDQFPDQCQEVDNKGEVELTIICNCTAPIYIYTTIKELKEIIAAWETRGRNAE